MIKDQLNIKVKNLTESKNNATIARKNMEIRLNETQFPFGKVPLNLDESVATFPIAVAIGFIISAEYLANCMRLRKELHSLYKIKYTERNILNKEPSLRAALWIDPINSIMNRLIKFLIFIIPFVVFIASCILISHYVIIREEDQVVTSLFYGSFIWFYVILYFIGASLFLYGISNILTVLHNYHSDLL